MSRASSPRPRLLALLLALTSLAPLGGCSRSDPPAERYRRFAAATRLGEADDAWAMLSEGSRAALDAAAQTAAARAPKGVVPASGKELLLGDLAPRAPKVREATVLRESRDEAVLKIVDEAGAEGQVTLVREGGEWRIVLPPLDLAAAPGTRP